MVVKGGRSKKVKHVALLIGFVFEGRRRIFRLSSVKFVNQFFVL